MFVKSIFLVCIMFSLARATANEPEPDNLFTNEAKLKKANQKPTTSNKTAASKKWLDGRIPDDKSQYKPSPEREQWKRMRERSVEIRPEMHDPNTSLFKPPNQ